MTTETTSNGEVSRDMKYPVIQRIAEVVLHPLVFASDKLSELGAGMGIEQMPTAPDKDIPNNK